MSQDNPTTINKYLHEKMGILYIHRKQHLLIEYFEKASAKAIEKIRVRFFKKVIKTNRCWIWIASGNSGGYGQIYINGRMEMAHKVSYLLAGKKILRGYDLDHKCQNISCVNPEHLRPLTHKENILIGNGATAINKRKTHCKWGHPLSGNNLRITAAKKHRACRACEHKWRGRERIDDRSRD